MVAPTTPKWWYWRREIGRITQPGVNNRLPREASWVEHQKNREYAVRIPDQSNTQVTTKLKRRHSGGEVLLEDGNIVDMVTP